MVVVATDTALQMIREIDSDRAENDLAITDDEILVRRKVLRACVFIERQASVAGRICSITDKCLQAMVCVPAY